MKPLVQKFMKMSIAVKLYAIVLVLSFDLTLLKSQSPSTLQLACGVLLDVSQSLNTAHRDNQNRE